jgi:hypothetical protein
MLDAAASNGKLPYVLEIRIPGIDMSISFNSFVIISNDCVHADFYYFAGSGIGLT